MKQIVENIELFSKLLKKYLNKDYVNNANRLIRDYYNLYYFISKLNLSIDSEDLNLEKPIVADEIYTDDNLNISVNALLEAGFTKYLTRSYMKLKISDKDGQLSENIKFSNEDEIELIFELQNKHIDKYTGNFSFKEDLIEEIKDNLILSIYEENNFVGYLRLKKNKKSLSLEGIVIDPRFRGKGYSKELVKYFIDYFSKESYNEISLWVIDDNLSAIRLYNFFSFEKTKYKCDNYIKF